MKLAALAIATLLILTGCGGSSDTTTSTPTKAPKQTIHSPRSAFDKRVITAVEDQYGKGGVEDCFVGLHTDPPSEWKLDGYYVYVGITKKIAGTLGPLSIHYERDSAQSDGLNINIMRPDGTPNPTTAKIFNTVGC